MAANKIDRLTPEQEAMLPAIRDAWYAHGLCTEPANRPEAERGAFMVYKDAEQALPPIVVWAQSPLAGAYITTALVDNAFGIDEAAYKLPEGTLIHGEGTCRELDNGDMEVTVRLDQKIGRKLNLKAKIKKQAAYNHVGRRIGGQYWAGYYAYFDAMKKLGMEGLDAIDGQMIVAKNANWWWALDKALVMVERPTLAVSLDDEGRLHHDTGPCIKFREDIDGTEWGVYAHHGVRIPPGKEFIFTDPDKVTGDVILAERNAELRRVMLEKVGYERVVEKMNLIDDNPEIGKLWMLELEDDEPLALFDCVDPSTGRRYLLRVDPNAYGGLKTARQASASTWRNPDGSMAFDKAEDYILAGEA